MYTDVYSNPQHHNMVMLGEIELKIPEWDFEIWAAWADLTTGYFYYGDDAGCSCPSPFEDYKDPKNQLAVAYNHRDLCNAVDTAVNNAEDKYVAMAQGQRIKLEARKYVNPLFEAAHKAVNG